jgi:hypothetical protein
LLLALSVSSLAVAYLCAKAFDFSFSLVPLLQGNKVANVKTDTMSESRVIGP